MPVSGSGWVLPSQPTCSNAGLACAEPGGQGRSARAFLLWDRASDWNSCQVTSWRCFAGGVLRLWSSVIRRLCVPSPPCLESEVCAIHLHCQRCLEMLAAPVGMGVGTLQLLANIMPSQREAHCSRGPSLCRHTALPSFPCQEALSSGYLTLSQVAVFHTQALLPGGLVLRHASKNRYQAACLPVCPSFPALFVAELASPGHRCSGFSCLSLPHLQGCALSSSCTTLMSLFCHTLVAICYR